ncbi:MAG: hypothetical protein ACFFDK_13680 [Promethearchaeota archaeon]
MIFHRILQIVDHNINQLDTLSFTIKKYFYSKLLDNYGMVNKAEQVRDKEILVYLRKELLEIGFDIQDIIYFFSGFYKHIQNRFFNTFADIMDFFEYSLYPLVEELFLYEFLKYLADIKHTTFFLNLKKKELLPIEILINIIDFKESFNAEPIKVENLKKYIGIKDKIIESLSNSKQAVFELQQRGNLPLSLQLLYYIYRIISLFNLEKNFDFNPLKGYLVGCCEDYLNTIPLVTLKNPDIYYCGIYLANQLNIELDNSILNSYFSDVFEELIDDFEAPFIQCTRRLYYLLKSMNLLRESLTPLQINRLLNDDSGFYNHTHLKTLETSRLIVILKIFQMLDVMKSMDQGKIRLIQDEIEGRIKAVENKEETLSSEFIYYTIFYYYTIDKLDALINFNLVKEIVRKIHRNIAIFVLNKDTCNDILSELLYSLESLKLLNSINSKESYSHLIKFLFPKVIKSKDMNNIPKIRIPRISKISGDISI